MTDFAHLHLHTHYSLLDGLGTPERYAQQMIANQQTSAAITDHGNLYGVVDWYKTLKKHDLHPVLGCEVYFTHDRRSRLKGGDNSTYHMLLFAETNEGYQNLLQLVTKANLEGFYSKPRIDWELLERYGKGLIGTSGCLSSLTAESVLSGNLEQALAYLKRYQSLLGKENFFLELQYHPRLPDQQVVNKALTDFAKSGGFPLLATNDCHYVHSHQHEAHDVLLCVQTNAQIEETHRMKFEDDFSLLPTQTMIELFQEYPEAITNSTEIARRCKVNIEFGRNLLPRFQTPQGERADVYLRKLVVEGLLERYELATRFELLLDGDLDHVADSDKALASRINFELETIHEMGFDTYFLIVWDFIDAAKKKGIVVGPGRGSAAGSLVAYCLKITDVDPLKYDLLFERFLNPARISMPDIDIDFQDDRREEVLDYVKQKYGEDHVAQVVTFGTMSAKAAVKDVGRVHGIPFQEMNQLTKLIPGKPGTLLAGALEEEVELRQEYERNSTFKKVFDTALELEGTIRQAGVHACAVIISPTPVSDYTALQKAPGSDNTLITQLSMKPLEDLGLLKMDFLGLRNLTIIKRTIDIVHQAHGVMIDIHQIPMEDTQAYELMARGDTTGVFQLESSGMKRYLKDLKPTNFEDIIAMVSLYRPGPMDFIPTYIDGKHGKKEVRYVHDDLKPILHKTYGIAIYQEQILQIAQKFAGFSLGDADLLRRAIGKKIASELTAQRDKFIQGGVDLGYSKKLATDIFDKVIEPFANYGFNKSHAACYALIAYQTAYLKAHYPTAFMAALLTADQDTPDRMIIDLQECEQMGIQILPPDINSSMRDFTVEHGPHIRFGFKGTKNLGSDTIDHILIARNSDGSFRTLGDLVSRLPVRSVNKKSLEALSMSGALDSLGERNAILQSLDLITTFAKDHGAHRKNNEGQTDIFGMMGKDDFVHHDVTLVEVPPASRTQKLQWEKQVFGVFISDHPLKGLRKYLSSRATLIGSLTSAHLEREITLCGIVLSSRKITTKRGEVMMTLELEDLTGKLQAVLFPRVYDQVKHETYIGADEYCLFLTGVLDRRGGERQFIVRSLKKGGIETMRSNAFSAGLFDEQESSFVPALSSQKGEGADSHEELSTSAPSPSSSHQILDDKLVDITDSVAQFAYDRLQATSKNTFMDDQEGDIVYRIRADLNTKDLKTIKDILLRHPGKKKVKLQLLVEGRRTLVDTNVSVHQTAQLVAEISPYVEQ